MKSNFKQNNEEKLNISLSCKGTKKKFVED
jgi:hypothetical protein